MPEIDFQLGGGYAYQWQCGILLALNSFFEEPVADVRFSELVTRFLGQVEAVHLEGEDRERDIELEDLNLLGAERRILIQVKTKKKAGQWWIPSDPLLRKALYRFYRSRFLEEDAENTLFVFLSNRPFNPTLRKIDAAVEAGKLHECPEVEDLYKSLTTYAKGEKKGSKEEQEGKDPKDKEEEQDPIDKDRFDAMLARTRLVEYLREDRVRSSIEVTLRSYTLQDLATSYARLYEHFSRLSTLTGGGKVTVESVIGVLGALVEGRPPLRAPGPKPPCPYPGMKPYRQQDKDRFFGREEKVAELLKELRWHPFLAVIGPSGSGKSSLVQAGLAPALPGSSFFDRDDWRVITLQPGEAPLTGLRDRFGSDLADPDKAVSDLLSGQPDARRLLLVVDQFEELFTQTRHEEVVPFQRALRQLLEVPRCYVALTVRADFYAQLMVSPLWPEIQAHRVEVLPLDEQGLRRAIVRPAEKEGVFVQQALVERLLADAAGEPGFLPFMQETLVLLWERMEGFTLSLSAYDDLVASGQAREGAGKTRLTGLQVAMAEHAERTMRGLGEHQKDVAWRVFLRLVNFDEGRPYTRRRQRLAELRTSGDEPRAFSQTLGHLVDHRLLTVRGEEGSPERQVDLAHEALLEGWPELGKRIGELEAKEQTRRRLEGKAVEWEQLERKGGLLDEVELGEAERWLASPDAAELGGVSEALGALMKASHEHHEREQRRWKQLYEEAEQRRIRAKVAETRAAAERGYARAERNRALARRVALQTMRPDRERYETTLLQRATEFESRAGALWNRAYALERTLGPSAEPGQSGEVLAGPGSGLFDLDVVTAPRRGGCFIVRYGTPATPRLVIVDGGNPGTYAKGLRAQLKMLREQILPGAPLPVELVIVTHYDMDRVWGIARLLEELQEAHDAGLPPLAKIGSVWFNHFLPEDMGKVKKEPVPPRMSAKDQIPRLASALGIGLNEPFDYFVMASEHGPARVTLAEGMRATVTAPDAAWLQEWYEHWRDDRAHLVGDVGDDLVQQTRLEPDQARLERDLLLEAVSAISEGFSSPEIELLRAPPDVLTVSAPAQPDRSAANLSSIVTLLEFGGRRMLFCGDSRCDHIARGLSQAGLLPPPDGHLHLEVMQVPHAGSRRNVTTMFFGRVTADHYVIVPESRFRLPDVEVLDMIVNARGDAQYAIHLPALARMSWLDPTRWSARLLERAVFHDNDTFTVSVPNNPT